jgi:hypothetical protein
MDTKDIQVARKICQIRPQHLGVWEDLASVNVQGGMIVRTLLGAMIVALTSIGAVASTTGAVAGALVEALAVFWMQHPRKKSGG